MNTTRPAILLAALLLLACAALAASLAIGSVDLAPQDVLAALAGGGNELARTLVLELRLPRALTAFAIGGLLALAGVLMQVLLRNPLADPYVMGISGGAAVAALAAMLLGLGGWLVDASATAGALAATLLVFTLAHGTGSWTPSRLLLTGIVVAAGCSAIVSALLALGDDSRLRGMLFWLMGDLSYNTRAQPLLVLLAVALVAGTLVGRHLNVLASGDFRARSLGVPVTAMRSGILVAGSLLTALSVTVAGTIGFIGLVTPHLARLAIGSDHRRVVPASILLGGTVLVLADLIARTAFAPRQLPVGALTALVGVPLFLALVAKGQRTTESVSG